MIKLLRKKPQVLKCKGQKIDVDKLVVKSNPLPLTPDARPLKATLPTHAWPPRFDINRMMKSTEKLNRYSKSCVERTVSTSGTYGKAMKKRFTISFVLGILLISAFFLSRGSQALTAGGSNWSSRTLVRSN